MENNLQNLSNEELAVLLQQADEYGEVYQQIGSELLKRNDNLIKQLVAKRTYTNLDFDDALQEARMLYIKYCKSFDISKNIKLNSYVCNNVLLRLPAIDFKSGLVHINKATNDVLKTRFSCLYGRAPHLQDLLDTTDRQNIRANILNRSSLLNICSLDQDFIDGVLDSNKNNNFLNYYVRDNSTISSESKYYKKYIPIAINFLPRANKKLIVNSFYDDQGLIPCCEEFSVTKQTVYNRYNKTLHILKQILSDEGIKTIQNIMDFAKKSENKKVANFDDLITSDNITASDIYNMVALSYLKLFNDSRFYFIRTKTPYTKFENRLSDYKKDLIAHIICKACGQEKQLKYSDNAIDYKDNCDRLKNSLLQLFTGGKKDTLRTHHELARGYIAELEQQA